MKKFASLLMAVVLLAAMLSAFAVTVSAASGTCGSSGNVHLSVPLYSISF